MKIYDGKRTIDGLFVSVNGRRLDEHCAIKRYSRLGFEWSYEGVNPRQLAFAILYDHFGDKERAMRLCKPFMQEIVANFDNEWTLTSADIETAIDAIEGRAAP